jgi:nucleotide-binding universal stress UspA family protein
MMFEKILVCLDGSDLAEQILPFAAEEARCFQGRLVLFHVVPEQVIVSPGIPGSPGVPVEMPGMEARMRQEQKQASAYLRKVAGKLREKGLEVETVVRQGAAGEAIIDYANRNDIGLIAIATHGRSGLGRAVFGSVADYVLRKSGLPILIIRPRNA